MATYPAAVKVFTTKTNVVDIIDAGHPNTLQDEVAAVQTVMGVNPHVSTTPSAGGTFVSTSQTFASIAARLANIETGIVADTHTQYVHLAGGDTMVASAAGVIPHRIRARADQTAALLRVESTDTTTAYLQVTTGGVAASALTVGGSPVLTQANAPSNLALASTPPPDVTATRATGTGTAAARNDHAHGPVPRRFTLMMMGA